MTMKAITLVASFFLTGLVGAHSLPPRDKEAVSEGVVIGEDKPEGLYQGTWDEDGKVVFLNFTPPEALFKRLSAKSGNLDIGQLKPRLLPINYVDCDPGWGDMIASEWNAAWGAFTSNCDHGAGANGHGWLAYYVGRAVAWMCNKGGSWQYCFRSEYDQVVDVISATCGGLHPAFADIDVWQKSYGRNHLGQPFCGNNGQI
jgi:hypothetical protein